MSRALHATCANRAHEQKARKATPNQLVVSHPPLISARMYFHQHQHNTKVYRLDFFGLLNL